MKLMAVTHFEILPHLRWTRETHLLILVQIIFPTRLPNTPKVEGRP
jgi:hypothetical protein